MNSKRIFGIVLFIIGIVMIVFSNSIAKQVAEGQGKISSAQSKVDMGNSLFSMNPATKEAGKVITGPAQSQINEGSQEVAYYTQVAHWLQIGGVAFLVAGLVCVILGKKK